MKHLTFIFLVLFLEGSQCLPQVQVDVDRDVAEVPELVQGPVHLAVKPTVDQVQDLINAVVDNVTGEYNNSAIPVLINTVSTIQDPASPLHFLLQIIPQPIVALLPRQARTGPVGATVGLVLLTVGIYYISTILYYIGFFIGKYILANIIFPNSVERMADEAAKAGRALLSDPATLDNLHQGVLKAVDKYNQLQEIYGEY